jgi:hypothetical protein
MIRIVPPGPVRALSLKPTESRSGAITIEARPLYSVVADLARGPFWLGFGHGAKDKPMNPIPAKPTKQQQA